MKKIIFALLVACLGILIIEIFSFASLSIAKKRWFSRSDMLENQRLLIESSGEFDPRFITKPGFMKRDILHPYVGFVLDYPTDADQYGFANTINPIQKMDENKVIIAVTGGSVAFQTYDYAIDTLINRLKLNEAFRDKEFIAIRLAAGGYKQPQQLMVLNYLLSLGGEFDIFINIDGFNESALPIAENIPKNVFPFFPRKWLLRVDLLSDPQIFQFVSEGLTVRKRRVLLAKVFGSYFLRNSFAFNLLWESIDYFLQVKIGKINDKATETLSSAQSYVAKGPSRMYEKDEDLFKDIADVWERSSIQMKVLCEANGIKYFHFLQPNQYFPGSKPLTKEERDKAFDASNVYRKPVEDMYPYLIAAGHKLKQANVNFKDMSMIFNNDERTLYVDTCCHLNEKGYKTMAEEIADSVLAHY